MKKNRYYKYDIDTLTRAINLLDRYEKTDREDVGDYPELDLIRDANIFMSKLKTYFTHVRPYLFNEDEFDVFRVITEISFDKLEKDVMGVN